MIETTVGWLLEYIEDIPVDTPIRLVRLPVGDKPGGQYAIGVPTAAESADGVMRAYIPEAERLDDLTSHIGVALRWADEDLGFVVSPHEDGEP